MEFTKELEAAQYTLTCAVQAREVVMVGEDVTYNHRGFAEASVQVTG